METINDINTLASEFGTAPVEWSLDQATDTNETLSSLMRNAVQANASATGGEIVPTNPSPDGNQEDTPMADGECNCNKKCKCNETSEPKEEEKDGDKKCTCKDATPQIINGKICKEATEEEKVAVRRADCQERYVKCKEQADKGYSYSWCKKRKRYWNNYYPYYNNYGCAPYDIN